MRKDRSITKLVTPAPAGNRWYDASPAAATLTAPANAVTGSAGTASPGYLGHGLPSDEVPLRLLCSINRISMMSITQLGRCDGILKSIEHCS